ncbi:unnamed protein product [Sphenostylis stenocarpa]|uniref:Uncharacterized protein n=1 Tax=Sphenostylis stenocarpa TaxID=92480 RepID=A0AA86SBX1_9FABA|nr:unnamed protein product [Sphenostylis stenocarpa]
MEEQEAIEKKAMIQFELDKIIVKLREIEKGLLKIYENGFKRVVSQVVVLSLGTALFDFDIKKKVVDGKIINDE